MIIYLFKINARRTRGPLIGLHTKVCKRYTVLQKRKQTNKHRNSSLPSLVAYHHDRMSSIQYLLPVVSQRVSCLLTEGRPMSVKTANDPPRNKQSLLALNHDKADEL